jgi:hypothetical protein
VLFALVACGSESKVQQPNAENSVPGSTSNSASSTAARASSPGLLAPQTPPSNGVGAQVTTPPGGTANAAGSGAPGAPTAAPGLPGQVPGGTPGTPGAGAQPAMANVPPPPQPFSGPLDGDASKPMVDIPGLKCGPLQVSFGGSPQTVKITNRDVVIGYPCAHEGAAVTFFLFLHGTLQEEMKVAFTMNAFAIHKLIDSHNVIMAVPKATGTQWGNGDNGVDLPHLYEVIDWVYATFGDRFNIRSMWSQGGSWGAAYLSQFACDPKLQDRLRGIQLIVGGGCPRCTNRLSCIVGQQELEKGGGMMLTPEMREMFADQSNIMPYATMHGCDAKMGPTPVGNAQYWAWPNCDKGWAHSYYMAPGNHADTWDPAVVLKMTEEMKGTEQ